MEAPLYPPATVYREPTPMETVFGVEVVSFEDILRHPELLRLVTEEIPGFEEAVRSSFLASQAGAMTFGMLRNFPGWSSADVERVDARLRAMPVSERPSL